jgi:hypothetical protein
MQQQAVHEVTIQRPQHHLGVVSMMRADKSLILHLHANIWGLPQPARKGVRNKQVQ